ncbi:hypothetical protein NDN08_000725 [Rhodosorus marinus]|uniref:ATP-dependent RNA helicase n=1 Tax=Rhodosorus marinus TaxID=101924 RepID=A0AAV8URK7_9RHOD|nr:hypothetical protein NDN08_000725 [Rhodosorus marinus]
MEDAKDEEEKNEDDVTFESLGLVEELCSACKRMGYKAPTSIQRETIPLALTGKDIIGLAQTGSGKTAAFALPVLNDLITTKPTPKGTFAVVIAPTRELVFQIHEQFAALGSEIGLRSVAIAGGIDMVSQAVALAKRPHVIVASPGRLVDHLEHTKGFSLRSARYLILDEADRLLNMDFEKEINKVISVLPRDRRSYLFSATMTSKVRKLQRASLADPAKVEVSDKYSTVDTLVQNYIFLPAKHKDCYLAFLLNEFAGNSTIVFCDTQNECQRLALVLRKLGFEAICIHGGMTQPKRLGALHKFKAKERNILIATDVAARGLDIPSVDLVVNYDIPMHGKDYVHRVGRTARAGRAGRAISLVSQYDVELYQKVEQLIGKKLDEYKAESSIVLMLQERISEAQRLAAFEMREFTSSKRGKRMSSMEGEANNADHHRGSKPKPKRRRR